MTQPVTCTHGKTLFQACSQCQKETTMSTQPHLAKYAGTYKAFNGDTILVEDRDDFPAAGYLRVTLADGTHQYQHKSTIHAHIDGGRWIRQVAATLALAITLLTTHGAAAQEWQQPVYPTDAYLAGCEEPVRYGDGSRVLYCPEDGETLYYDADGQIYANDAGAPRRAPGHWYAYDPR